MDEEELKQKKSKIIEFLKTLGDSSEFVMLSETKDGEPSRSTAISMNLFKLMEEFNAPTPLEYAERYADGNYDYYEVRNYVKTYDECEVSQQKELEEKKAKQKEVIESDDPKYDEVGSLFLPIYNGNKPQVLEIENITPRMLATLGIDIGDLGIEWKSEKDLNKENFSKAIAKLGKAKGLTIKNIYEVVRRASKVLGINSLIPERGGDNRDQ